MKDYYTILGVNNSASDAEIKKAFRKLAMSHHPDRGGDDTKFKEIQEAYAILSDEQKKKEYDFSCNPNNSFNTNSFFNFNFHGGDPFNGFYQHRMRPKNHDTTIHIKVSLRESLFGKQINAEIGLPSGMSKMISIDIPAGIENGQQIKYPQMGDTSMPHLPPGDLIVVVFVTPDPGFIRLHNNVVCEKTITAWEAMMGTTLEFTSLSGNQLKIVVPPGTQPETKLRCRGEGFPDIHSKVKGDLHVIVKITIPKLSAEQATKLKTIHHELSN